MKRRAMGPKRQISRSTVRSWWRDRSDRIHRGAAASVAVAFTVASSLVAAFGFTWLRHGSDFRHGDRGFWAGFLLSAAFMAAGAYLSVGWVSERLNAFRTIEKDQPGKAVAIISLVSLARYQSHRIEIGEAGTRWVFEGSDSDRAEVVDMPRDAKELLGSTLGSRAESLVLLPVFRSRQTLRHVTFVPSKASGDSHDGNGPVISFLSEAIPTLPEMVHKPEITTTEAVDYDEVEQVFDAIVKEVARLEDLNVAPRSIYILATPGTTTAAIGAAMATMNHGCRFETFRQNSNRKGPSSEDAYENCQLFNVVIRRDGDRTG